ncbi:MAG: undecaprenyl-diphosphate phosphatase [Gammaproteobacteria bacterium]
MLKILSVSNEGMQYLKLIIIGSIPLPIIGLLFVDSVSTHMRSVESIALMTIIFAFILYFADTKNKDTISELKSISIFTIIFIGLMQTLAIMPGVSRAGIVITAALLANYSREDSIKIAFLLSIPAIFMANCLSIHAVIWSRRYTDSKRAFIRNVFIFCVFPISPYIYSYQQ